MTDLRLATSVDLDKVVVRPGAASDLAQINDIYNHYILTTPITFDIEPFSDAQRASWFKQFSPTGPHRLLVAFQDDALLGWAGTYRYRDKAAYNSTVETTIYCHPEATGRGIGRLLYERLFEAIADEDLNMAIAGVTLPTEASVAVHQRLGFQPVGVTHAVGRKFGRYWDVGWFEKPLT
jgi:phosphinothricin acetyltransferase